MATHSYKHGRGKEKNALTYSDLSHTAEECETFQFLAGIYSVMVNPVCNVISKKRNFALIHLFYEDMILLVVNFLYNVQLELINYITENMSL